MPAVCAIEVAAEGGGIAAVSRMAWSVVQRQWPRTQLIVLHPGDAGRAGFVRKGRFAARIASAQVLGRVDWILFTHLQLLRVQQLPPAGLRRPYAVFLHGIEAWGPLSDSDTHLLAGATLRLANSEFTARRVMAAHPDVGPVVACPLALMPPEDRRDDPADDDEGDAPDEGRDDPAGRTCDDDAPVSVGPAAVLIVGRMLAAERYKGHDQLIDAWPRVLQSVPAARLIVIGDGDDAARLRERAAQAGTPADAIVFTGFIGGRTLDLLYDRCAVFAMPSRGEGFGLVYLEAMAHRLPCIGCRDNAAAEVIVDGETGILVDQADLGQLADAVVRLLSDRELRARMGAAGFRRAHDRFSFERFSSQLVGELRAAFEQPAGTAAAPKAFA